MKREGKCGWKPWSLETGIMTQSQCWVLSSQGRAGCFEQLASFTSASSLPCSEQTKATLLRYVSVNLGPQRP